MFDNIDHEAAQFFFLTHYALTFGIGFSKILIRFKCLTINMFLSFLMLIKDVKFQHEQFAIVSLTKH